MRARPRFSRLPSSPNSWAMARVISTAWSWRDEDVDVRGHALTVGQAAPGQQIEAEGAVVGPGRPQADVVDLGLGAVLHAPGHRDLELPGQVGVLAVAGEEVDTAWATGRPSNASWASTPDTGQLSTLRAESPHACTVVRPTAANRRQMRGMSSMRNQWICTV